MTSAVPDIGGLSKTHGQYEAAILAHAIYNAAVIFLLSQ